MRSTRLNLLSDRKVKHAPAGLTSDGGGLYIRNRNGNLAWMFRYTQDGKKREMGMGSYPAVSLASARERATAARECLAGGGDPKAAGPAPVAAVTGAPTFRTAMDRYLQLKGAEWSNKKHASQWPNTLNTYARSLMDMPVDQITAQHVVGVLAPIWQTKAETASRVRQRIEAILGACIVFGDRPGPNPAQWKYGLELVMGRQKAVVKHHEAVAVATAPDAFLRLWSARDKGMGAQGAIMCAMSCLRSGEVRKLQWDMWDGGDTIHCPAAIMKREHSDHRVHVPAFMQAWMSDLPRWAHSDLILPGHRGKPMSDNTIRKAQQVALDDKTTPHGWRSTFTDWATESGYADRWVADTKHHQIGDATERAYRRTDYLQQRRPMLDDWVNYLTSKVNDT
jgi:integrase